MKVQSEQIGRLEDHQLVCVVAVQTDSPITTERLVDVPVKNGPARIGWDPRAESTRIEEVQAVLRALVDLPFTDTIRSVIAFPEYSVPRRAHEGRAFQNYANQTKCILIPGSYWDDTPGGGGHQVCRIYVPGRGEPLQISKLNPVPEEEKFMVPGRDKPNVARLVWARRDGTPVSINVYLCRDYLALGRQGSLALDGEEGLNLVLMHSRETRLFEGAAGIDLRGLRGKHRLSLFVQTANAAPNAATVIGSALLGAAKKREENDVVASLPPDRIGVLVANVRLWDIELTIRQPDTRTDAPVGSVATYSIEPESNSAEVLLAPLKALAPTPGYRAIWRPVFLEAIDMGVTIEFFPSTRLMQIIRLFEQKRVHKVYAGIVRGQHDIVVRRYFRRTGRVPGEPSSSFRDDCKPDVKNILEHSLEEEGAWRLEFNPRQILKYRGKPTEVTDFYGQVRAAKQLLGPQDDPEFNTLVKAVHSLAVQCEANLQLPEVLQTFLYDEPEQIIPVGPGCDAREIYLFVAIGGAEVERFAKKYISEHIMTNDLVREVFRIEQVTTPQFRFLFKLKSTSAQADDLIMKMLEWGEGNRVDIGTRTIELGRYLAQSSLSSVTDCMLSQNLIDFVNRIKLGNDRADAELAHELMLDDKDYTQLFAIANASAKVSNYANRMDDTPDRVFAFYSSLLFYCVVGDPAKPRYFERIKVTWKACFDPLEADFQKTLDALDHAGLIPATPGQSRLDAIRQFAFKTTNEVSWGKLTTDVAKQVYAILKQLNIDEAGANEDPEPLTSSKLKDDVAFLDAELRPLRNDVVHGNDTQLAPRFDLSEQNYKHNLARLTNGLMGIVGQRKRLEIVRRLAEQGHLRIRL